MQAGRPRLALADDPKPAAPPPTPVVVAPVQEVIAAPRATYTGFLEPVDQGRVNVQEAGTVQEILKRSGDRVKPGEMLATLANPQLKLDLEVVEAQLKEAQASLAEAQQKLAEYTGDRHRWNQRIVAGMTADFSWDRLYSQFEGMFKDAKEAAGLAEARTSPAMLAKAVGEPLSHEVINAHLKAALDRYDYITVF